MLHRFQSFVCVACASLVLSWQRTWSLLKLQVAKRARLLPRLPAHVQKCLLEIEIQLFSYRRKMNSRSAWGPMFHRFRRNRILRARITDCRSMCENLFWITILDKFGRDCRPLLWSFGRRCRPQGSPKSGFSNERYWKSKSKFGFRCLTPRDGRRNLAFGRQI